MERKYDCPDCPRVCPCSLCPRAEHENRAQPGREFVISGKIIAVVNNYEPNRYKYDCIAENGAWIEVLVNKKDKNPFVYTNDQTRILGA